uniref:Retrovirus-related Pol polyprotein from transposon TNT 1-94-like beta-barrel domain-containing protein n=1 Tax=Cannabis sativa TaxID=3483 RepID=A0A803P3U5_CANSA
MASSGNNSSPAGISDPNAAPQAQATSSWNPFSHSLTSSLTIKLDRTHFLAWKSQVLPTVIGHELDEILLTNLSHASPQCYTSFNAVWTALEQKFSSQSKARLLQLKSQLSNIQKGNQSISDYVDKIKVLCDSLAIAGHPISDLDLVLHLLNGLGPEFDSVVSGITTRSDNVSRKEVQALLLSHETRLERHTTMMDLSNKMAANLTFGSRNGGSRPYNNAARGEPIDSSRFPSRGQYFSQQQQSSSHNRPLCQVCMRYGHTAPTCHYRFDKNWVNPKSVIGNPQPQVNITEQTLDYDPTAFVAQNVPGFGDDQGWYVDTGATHHISYSEAPLDTTTPYSDSESVAVGDGKKLIISHIGKAFIPSKNSSPLLLNSVLQVPSITKNLVSVSNLTHDNNVFLEFHKTCCFVKDKQTGAVLLKGQLKDGLYLLGDEGSSLSNTSIQCHI